MDTDKQIAFWRDSLLEDLAVARQLHSSGRDRHALFWAHLVVEKALKARYVKATGQHPPRIHNLGRLAKLAGVTVSAEEREHLADLNQWQINARYQQDALPVSHAAPAQLLRFCEEFSEWLIKEL